MKHFILQQLPVFLQRPDDIAAGDSQLVNSVSSTGTVSLLATQIAQQLRRHCLVSQGRQHRMSLIALTPSAHREPVGCREEDPCSCMILK